MKHDYEDLAKTLKELTDAREIKDEAAVKVVTNEWNDMAPDFLMELFDEKMKQNPTFLDRLIQTAPLPLIESSTSMRWGEEYLSTQRSMTVANFQGQMGA